LLVWCCLLNNPMILLEVNLNSCFDGVKISLNIFQIRLDESNRSMETSFKVLFKIFLSLKRYWLLAELTVHSVITLHIVASKVWMRFFQGIKQSWRRHVWSQCYLLQSIPGRCLINGRTPYLCKVPLLNISRPTEMKPNSLTSRQCQETLKSESRDFGISGDAVE
jgi:hypothetical protein